VQLRQHCFKRRYGVLTLDEQITPRFDLDVVIYPAFVASAENKLQKVTDRSIGLCRREQNVCIKKNPH
jgi:hypothetical protein